MAERCATYAMLDSALFDLPHISHMINIGQVAQHLSRDLMFISSDGMAQAKDFFFRKVPVYYALNLLL